MTQPNILNSQTQTRPTEQGGSSPSGRRAAREIVLLLTTVSISPSRKKRISQLLRGNVDWRYLLDLAEFHNIASLIAYNLTANGLASQVPQLYVERMRQIYTATLCRNVILSHELVKVLSVFSQHGIGVISLKGTVLADQLYGNPALRTMADIDILVKPEGLSLASSLLVEMGYEQLVTQQVQGHPFHEVYSKQMQFPIFIELHWNLDDEKLVSVPGQIIWHRAQRLQIQEGSTMILSPEDNFLFLSNHFTKHNEQQLRSLCDITELLKKYDGVLDWDYIIESAYSWGVGTGVYYSLRRSQELLRAPVPASTIRKLRPKAWRRWMIDFLVSKEVFISTTRLTKLRTETYTVIRSLMMRHVRQTLAVLSEYRGSGNKGAWLRTAIWMILVFGAALMRNMARVVSGWRWSDA